MKIQEAFRNLECKHTTNKRVGNQGNLKIEDGGEHQERF